MSLKVVALIIASTLCTSLWAQGSAAQQKGIEVLREQGYSIRTITPVFNQLVSFSYPTGFVPAFEDTKAGHYVHESVLQGETVKKWSQMVTITGAKGLASNANVTPARFAGGIAGGFQRVCPDSYTATGLGEIKFGSHEGFAAVISCGVASPVGETHSESMLLVVIKGESDYYTIQWAERGKASKTPLQFDEAKWVGRFKILAPIKLCPKLPGEQPPYPSCANRT